MFQFNAACHLISPTFSLNKFFNDFQSFTYIDPSTTRNTLDKEFNKPLPQTDVNLEYLTAHFTKSGLESTPALTTTLLKVLFTHPQISIDIMGVIAVYSSRGLVNPHHLLHYYTAYLPITEVFFKRLKGVSEKIRFDIRAFEEMCIDIHSGFLLRVFIERLLIGSEDKMFRELLVNCGVSVDDEKYLEILTTLCGDADYIEDVVREWKKVLVEFGVEGFLKPV